MYAQKHGKELTFFEESICSYAIMLWANVVSKSVCLLSGKSVPPPKPSQSNPDYVQCPYCDRRFEEYAAERHMPFCKEKNSRIERRPRGSKDTEKLNKRIMVGVYGSTTVHVFSIDIVKSHACSYHV